MSNLLTALRSNSKNGHLFDSNGTMVAYKTSFPVIDYALGMLVNVFDDNGDLVKTYKSLGVTGGSIVTVIAKNGCGKTSWLIQASSNIVRPFKNGLVIHLDLEGGTNMTRIGNLSRFSPSELKEKYILRQEGSSIEEIKATIAQIYLEKKSHPELYMYDTGLVDEFGVPIQKFVPTCMIVDSVPTMTAYINENTKDGLQEIGEITSQTDRTRLTGLIGRFLTESLQMCRSANIILFLVNHIKDRISMGVPKAPEMRLLKMDETLPAGKALLYYTNTMLRFTAIGSEKYNIEEHGFDGFGVNAQLIKNRSNVDGAELPLVFSKTTGYDSIRSSVMYAKSVGLLGGNRNGYYFINNKEAKFTMKNIHEDFNQNRELYKIMYNHIIPVLDSTLSSVKPEEMNVNPEEMAY